MGSTLGSLRNAMPGMGGTDVADPGQGWSNMDPSQRAAGIIGGLGKGFGQGLQNYQQQNQMMRRPQGGASFMPAQGAAPLDPSYFLPRQSRGPNNLNFYGEGQ